MRDLVRLSGLPRETIHFYLAQGLLPKPVKTGRNTAVYGEEHLDRLRRIKDLQETHFLPLRAIKAVLDERDGGGFSPEQELLLRRVRDSAPPLRSREVEGDVALSSLVPSRLPRSQFDGLRRLGLVETKGRGKQATVSPENARIIEAWGQLLDLLQDGEPELTADLLVNYADAMEALVAREARWVTAPFAELSGERAAELIESAEPLVAKLLVAFRRKKIAALLASVDPSEPPKP